MNYAFGNLYIHVDKLRENKQKRHCTQATDLECTIVKRQFRTTNRVMLFNMNKHIVLS